MTLATIATRIAGAAAMTENSPTIRMCSRAPARPLRRACMTSHTSRTMMPSSSSTVAAFTRSSVTTTLWVGAIGVRSARTTKVTKADSSASTTASGPSTRVSAALGLRTGERSFGGGGLFDAHRPPAADGGAERALKARGVSTALPGTDAFIQQCCRIATKPRRGNGSSMRPGRQLPPRNTWMSRSRIFLRNVLRLRPSRSAARIWLPRVAASAAVSSGYSISRRMR